MGNHTHCRVCGEALPPPFLDLGTMPLANAFLRSPAQFAAEPSYPLAVSGCTSCGLVQLDHVVPAEELYRDYIYVSATSDAVRAHAEWLADGLVRRHGWNGEHLVVEVASNDGTVLKAFQRRGTRVLGVEPARNIAVLAEQDGVPTEAEFFTETTATALRSAMGEAAVIVARHVFGHVDDVHDFLRGVRSLLAKDGWLVIEVPYLGELVAGLEFDTIYHEHLSYFALGPIERLCAAHDLRLIDVELVALHGGSMILHIAADGTSPPPSERLERLRRREREEALTSAATLAAFAARVREWRRRFEEFIQVMQNAGAVLIGYGAAAKANTLLNYSPAAASALRVILDRSPLKQGLYTPGTHVPVVAADRWADSGATHMLILAWNFADEIVRQMRPFAAGGGRFVVPLPKPRLL